MWINQVPTKCIIIYKYQASYILSVHNAGIYLRDRKRQLKNISGTKHNCFHFIWSSIITDHLHKPFEKESKKPEFRVILSINIRSSPGSWTIVQYLHAFYSIHETSWQSSNDNLLYIHESWNFLLLTYEGHLFPAKLSRDSKLIASTANVINASQW